MLKVGTEQLSVKLSGKTRSCLVPHLTAALLIRVGCFRDYLDHYSFMAWKACEFVIWCTGERGVGE